MNLFPVVGAVLVAAVTAAMAGGSSAYHALRVATLNAGGAARLVEMTGDRGEPEPAKWTMLFSDPTARGGVREVVVSGETIVAQRTPLRGFAGVGSDPVMDLRRLNVDSDAAFQIANGQASDARLGFHWIDYTLRTNTSTGAPMWVMRLKDHMGAPVGVIQISAEDGSVIMPLRVESASRQDENTSNFADTTPGRQIGGVIGTVESVGRNTVRRVSDATLRAVGTVQEVLTGERTIGPQEENP